MIQSLAFFAVPMSGQGQQLPLWVQYAQALGALLLVLVIGVVGAALTRQQVKIAQVSLQHDLYDRRFAVFEATREFLVTILREVSLQARRYMRIFSPTPPQDFVQ